MSKGFFITGTDTGVGKTVIAAALIKAAGILGLRACGMKPIETGCKKEEFKIKAERTEALLNNALVPNSELIPTDGMFLREIARMDDTVDLVTPVRFEDPLAPLTASEIEDVPVDLDKIRAAYSELAGRYDAVIVEGIGGLLVPIRIDYSVLDLAKDFALPLIIVSRPGLGTINHTLLTVNYAIKEGLRVAGIIINFSGAPEGTIAEKTNEDILKRISPVPVIGAFPYLETPGSASIEQALLKNLDLKIIGKCLDQQ